MDWTPELEADETVRWEGRPAPRCYTFRNWRHSLFGVLLLLLATCWLLLGVELVAVYDLPWLPLIPVPFVLAGLYLGPGHLLLARLEWERVCYAVTDRRLLIRRGLIRRGLGGRRLQEVPLDRVVWFRLQPHGEDLGTVQVRSVAGERLVLPCIEHPRRVTALLESAMARSGAEPGVVAGSDGV